LIDGVNGFALANTATQNKNLRNQMKVGVIGIMLTATLVVLAKNNARDSNGLPTMTANNSSEMGGLGNGSHQHGSFNSRYSSGLSERGGYRKTNESVHHQNRGARAGWQVTEITWAVFTNKRK
jgi:hypothetical protein